MDEVASIMAKKMQESASMFAAMAEGNAAPEAEEGPSDVSDVQNPT